MVEHIRLQEQEDLADLLEGELHNVDGSDDRDFDLHIPDADSWSATGFRRQAFVVLVVFQQRHAVFHAAFNLGRNQKVPNSKLPCQGQVQTKLVRATCLLVNIHTK